jgi:GIY-YIG catalytic domain
MKIDELIPRPLLCKSFRRNQERFIPKTSGCYVLTTFEKVILYVGLTNDLRRRINEHLDNSEKTTVTQNGKAVLFFWIENKEINKIERTWLNMHIQFEGAIPVLNKIYSPTSV